MANATDDLESAVEGAQGPAPSPTGAAVARAKAKVMQRGLIPRFRRYQAKDFAEDPVGQITVLVVGPKSTSKTATTFRSFPGSIRDISCDVTSQQIRDGYFAGGSIHVLNGVKKWFQGDTTVEEWHDLNSGELISGPVCQLSAIDQIQYIGDYLRNKEIMDPTNWVMIDDVEILMGMITQQARYEVGLPPVRLSTDNDGGDIWQARTMIWAGIKQRMRACATNGVIFTCHPKQANPDGWWKPKKAVTMQTGTGETSEKTPAWFKQLVNEADLILETGREWNGALGGFTYTVKTISAKPIAGKDDMLKTGSEFDVTDFKPIPWGPGMKRWFEKITGKALPTMNVIRSAVADEIKSTPEGDAPPASATPEGAVADALDALLG